MVGWVRAVSFFLRGGRFWQHEYNLHNIEKVILMLWVIGVQYIHWRTYRSSLFVCFVTFKGLFVIKKKELYVSSFHINNSSMTFH